MKIILLQDVPKVGKKYDMKEMNDGYAYNFLIPRNLAIVATKKAQNKIDTIKKKEEGNRKIHEELLLKNLKDLNGITLTIKEKASEKGHLFAGIHREEIVRELKEQTRLEVEPSFIILEHPIKEIGEHIIEVKAGEKTVKFNLNIEAK